MTSERPGVANASRSGEGKFPRTPETVAATRSHAPLLRPGVGGESIHPEGETAVTQKSEQEATPPWDAAPST